MEFSNAIEILRGAWPTVQPAVSTVFGAVVASLFLRKNTAKEEIEKLKQSKFSEVADTLLEQGHITNLEYYKCRNFTKIARKADKIFCEKKVYDTTQVNLNEFVDFDWFVRFFEDCGGISNEDMQDIWASILAGEIIEPGSFSRQTLDVLRNLSQADAELFEEVSQYVALREMCPFIYADDSILRKYNGLFSKILHLNSCGLINSQPVTVDQPMEYGDTKTLFNTKDFVCCLKSIPEPSNAPPFGSIEISVFSYNRVGKELLKITTTQPQEVFILDCVTAINKMYSHSYCVTATLHKVNNSELGYDETPILTGGHR